MSIFHQTIFVSFECMINVVADVTYTYDDKQNFGSSLYHGLLYMILAIGWQWYRLDYGITKYTPHFALTGEVWSVLAEYFEEKISVL